MEGQLSRDVISVSVRRTNPKDDVHYQDRVSKLELDLCIHLTLLSLACSLRCLFAHQLAQYI